MKTVRLIFLTAILVTFFCCVKGQSNDNNYQKIEKTDKNGYTYETYTNDPVGVRIYTLDNGLKVYLNQNFNTSRIVSTVVVKAGSIYDPSDNTGLAHYLEHLLFNGNDKIGAFNWEKEKVILDEITQLYEAHKDQEDKHTKSRILKKIDSLTFEASKISNRSEFYDLRKILGNAFDNAITNSDKTRYFGLFPKTSLERFLHLEAERFRTFVPRSFQNTLETVYEEYNIEQDNVWKKNIRPLIMKRLKFTHLRTLQ